MLEQKPNRYIRIYIAWLILLATLPACAGEAQVQPKTHAAGKSLNNLLRNGDFQSPLLAGKRIPHWSCNAAKLLAGSNGNLYLSLRTTSATRSASASQPLPLQPDWAVLRLTARINIKSIAPGRAVWHDARIALCQKLKNGKSYYPRVPYWRKPTAGWENITLDIPLQPNAVSLGIQPAIFQAIGEMEIDDIRITVARRKGDPTPLPADKKLYWGKEPIRQLSATRARICLNGIWLFAPAPAIKSVPGNAEWGYIRVPGSWRPCALPGVIVRGMGKTWNGFPYKTSTAFYRRRVHIPGSWAGKSIMVRLARVSTDAVVFVDSRECGRVSWPAGSVDITSAVTPGKDAELNIFVAASTDKALVTRFMGPAADQIIRKKAKLKTCGLISDVFLEALPPTPRLTSVHIDTSVQSHTLGITATMNTPLSRPGTPITCTATISNPDNTTTRTFTARIAPAANKASLFMSWSWNDPHLWSTDDPYLYTLTLRIRGGNIDDEIRRTFGFREFRIQGREFYLNNIPIRLRPTPYHVKGRLGGAPALIRAGIRSMKECGFNIHEIWPWDRMERGTWHFDETWCREADRAGLLLIAPLPEFRQYTRKWQQPETVLAWEESMARAMEEYRDHPSVVMWSTGVNTFGFVDDQNPTMIGDRHRARHASAAYYQHARTGLDAMRRIRQHDPTRPVFMHAGAAVGDVYTLNNYLCMLPLQEREQWLSNWYWHGDMPVMMVEFGTPLYTTMMRGRKGYGLASGSEPLVTEFCASYLGTDAYRLESQAYRDMIASHFDKEQTYRTFHNSNTLIAEPQFQRLLSLFVRNTWRSWRTYGITGGILPWGHAHGWQYDPGPMQPAPAFVPGQTGTWFKTLPANYRKGLSPGGIPALPVSRVLKEVSGATMAYIAGKPGKFTAKTHSFTPGQVVCKQAVMINDTLTVQKYSLQWSAAINAKDIAHGNANGILQPTEILRRPIRFPLPMTRERFKADGRILLRVQIGTQTHNDTFRFRIIEPDHGFTATATVFDPREETRLMLANLGCKLIPWTGKHTNLPLIIGRKALSSGTAPAGDWLGFVRQGGVTIIMAQDPQWMRDCLGLRVSRYVSRRVFPLDSGNPVIAGLDSTDLRDWAGSSNLIPDNDCSLATGKPGSRYPPYGWHWGNQGGVTSAAIEKPHHSGMRPLMECGFDLAYSPLMEMPVGKGTIIWCMLDLVDHWQLDPVAQLLTQRLIQYAQNKPKRAWPEAAQVSLMGDASDAALLGRLGVKFTTRASVPADSSGLLVIGKAVGISMNDAQAFCQRGGRVLWLQREGEDAFDKVRLATKSLAGSLAAPDWPECRGLSASDLRWRVTRKAWVLQAGDTNANVEVAANGLLGRKKTGKGVMLFCQIDPRMFPADKLTYLRFTRWRQERTLSQILANLGANFIADDKLLTRLQAPDKNPGLQPIKLAGAWKALQTIILKSRADGKPIPDPGISPKAAAAVRPDTVDAEWQVVRVPGEWENLGTGWINTDGEVVFRRTVNIPQAWAGKDLCLSLGPIDDFDTTFYNGVAIGHMDIKTPKFWSTPRKYRVPGRLVKPGKAVIAVRIFDHKGGGGLVGRPRQMFIAPADLPANPLYHPDYRTDFPLGDDPFRYYRW